MKIAVKIFFSCHAVGEYTDLGGEVEAESVWCHERSPLVRLPQDSSEGKVQGVCPRVVLHHQTPSVLQGEVRATSQIETKRGDKRDENQSL